MSEIDWPDFLQPVDGIKEDEVLRFAKAWNEGGYVDISRIHFGYSKPGSYEYDGWIYEARRVLWTLQHMDEIKVDE